MRDADKGFNSDAILVMNQLGRSWRKNKSFCRERKNVAGVDK